MWDIESSGSREREGCSGCKWGRVRYVRIRIRCGCASVRMGQSNDSFRRPVYQDHTLRVFWAYLGPRRSAPGSNKPGCWRSRSAHKSLQIAFPQLPAACYGRRPPCLALSLPWTGGRQMSRAAVASARLTAANPGRSKAVRVSRIARLGSCRPPAHARLDTLKPR